MNRGYLLEKARQYSQLAAEPETKRATSAFLRMLADDYLELAEWMFPQPQQIQAKDSKSDDK